MPIAVVWSIRALFLTLAAGLLFSAPARAQSQLPAVCEEATLTDVMALPGKELRGGGTTLSTNPLYTGDNTSYLKVHTLDETIDPGSALSIRFQLNGWDHIRYVAYGWVDENDRFWHLKAKHVLQGNVYEEIVSIDHPLFQLTNPDSAEAQKASLKAVRLFVIGTPGSEGASIDLMGAAIINHGSKSFFDKVAIDNKYCPLTAYRTWADIPETVAADALYAKLIDYLQKQTPTFEDLAEDNTGPNAISMRAIPKADWPYSATVPPTLEDYTTARYLWHALNPVMASILSFRSTGDVADLFFAHTLFNRWYDENIVTLTDDPKYAWYDHGTAERAMVLAALYREGVSFGIDDRTKARLLHALVMHGYLLGSESFYARNQPDRWHNHAIFQDAALMSVGGMLAPLNAADQFTQTAQQRGLQQFEALTTTAPGFVINNENSSSYHTGMILLCQLMADTEGTLLQTENKFTPICSGLEAFDSLLRYPDGRYPAYGDSHRRENSLDYIKIKDRADNETGLWSFPDAGIVIAQGKSQSTPWQFTMVATDQSIVHKQSDNLSFSFWAAGIEWLIDLGFFTYEFDNPTTIYARGPTAHNRVVLDDIEASPLPDQIADLNGSIENDGTYHIQGSDQTYWPQALIERQVSIDPSTGIFLITDELVSTEESNQDSHPLPASTLYLHVGEGIQTNPTSENVFELLGPDNKSKVKIAIADTTPCRLISSRTNNAGDPILGHSFPRFAEAVPITTIACPLGEDGKLEWSLSLRP